MNESAVTKLHLAVQRKPLSEGGILGIHDQGVRRDATGEYHFGQVFSHVCAFKK